MAAAASNISIKVTGCPGPVASLTVTDLQLQLLKSVTWSVTAQAAVDPSLGALQLDAGSTRDVTYGLRFLAQPQSPQKQLAGSVVVANVGLKALLLQQLFVEVLPLDMGALGQPPVILPVKCAADSSIAIAAAAAATTTGSSSSHTTSAPLLMAAVPAGSQIRCSFAGVIPQGLAGQAAVTARVLLADGSSFASSSSLQYDLSVDPQLVVSTGQCAIVSDGYIGGRGRIVPQRTSRPASAAAPTRICNTQSVSFVASLGPFQRSDCGKKLWVSTWQGAGLSTEGGS